jgi:hypothetical protein
LKSPTTYLSQKHDSKTEDTMTSIENILNFFISPAGVVSTFFVLIAVNYLVFRRFKKQDE